MNFFGLIVPALEINTTSYEKEPTNDIDSFDLFVDNLESVNCHLNWLKFPDSTAYYNQAHGKHTKGTGQWFLRSEFDNWQCDPQSFLWLHGKGKLTGRYLISCSVRGCANCFEAGSGKTILRQAPFIPLIPDIN
jgi:hypothetical protein